MSAHSTVSVRLTTTSLMCSGGGPLLPFDSPSPRVSTCGCCSCEVDLQKGIGFPEVSLPRAADRDRIMTRDAAYRSLAITILGLDVATLVGELSLDARRVQIGRASCRE